MNIQLLFNTAELSWSHTLFSGIIGALIGGLVSGGITFFQQAKNLSRLIRKTKMSYDYPRA